MRKRLLQCSIPLFGLAAVLPAHAENSYLFSLMGGVSPRYLGSRDYRTIFTPLFAARFDNGLFLSMEDGAGYKAEFANGLFVSAALTLGNGRDDQNRFNRDGSDYLRGMGGIPNSLMFSVSAGAHIYRDATLGITLDQPLTHTQRGLSGHLDLKVPVLETGANKVELNASLHAGGSRYTQTFFGVTEAQAANTGFAPYTTKGGFDHATLGAAWTYTIAPRWSVNTAAGFTRLIGSPGNSPIVQTKNNWFGMSMLTYRY